MKDIDLAYISCSTAAMEVISQGAFLVNLCSAGELVNTGIHPAYSDPFDSLPEPYQKIVRAYHKLSPGAQKEFESYLEYLVQKDQK